MRRISEDIKTGNFNHIYLLYGNELYLRKQYTDKLRKALCNSDDQMNCHFYDGKDVNCGEIIDLAETLPFLAERRVIFISNSGLFKAGGEQMAEYLQNPNDTTYFVFSENEVDKRSKMYKSVASNGYISEFASQNENVLKKWIAQVLAKDNKKIRENVVELLLSKTGTDMENIYSELEKLICYTYGRDEITAQDVNEICTTVIEDHIFDMTEAMANKNTQKALSLYYDLLALKVPAMRILFLISKQYNQLFQVKSMKLKGFDNKAIASTIGLPPFVIGKYISQASSYKLSQLKKYVESCVQAEEDIKTGRMNDLMSVELILLSNH